MPTFLWSDIVFGPIFSRRLGASLGINLLPVDGKLCSFDCIYCECGFNVNGRSQNNLPTREDVKSVLEDCLKQRKKDGISIDSLTFAGNGEPTLHPDFESVIDDTIALRNKYFPETKISVLSNATMIHNESVFRALNKIDNNILKLDAALDETMKLIDQPNSPSFNIDSLINQLKRFNGNLIVQTMFLRGNYNNKLVDNTGDEAITALIKLLKEINPKQVMIYTIARETPTKELKKISLEELSSIAQKLECAGFEVFATI